VFTAKIERKNKRINGIKLLLKYKLGPGVSPEIGSFLQKKIPTLGTSVAILIHRIIPEMRRGTSGQGQTDRHSVRVTSLFHKFYKV